MVVAFAQRSDALCEGISGTDAPQRRAVAVGAPKDSLTSRLQASTDFCDQSLKSLDDRRLGDTVFVRMTPDGAVPPRTRAAVMTLATAYWAEAYGQLAQYVRLNGRVPPIPCRAPSGEGNCDNSVNRCVETTRGVPGSTFAISDGSYSVTSDGRGPYRRRTSNVSVVYIGWPLVLNLSELRFDTLPPRAIRVDLSKPVPGDIGVPRGVITADRGVEVGAQWYTEENYSAHSMLDIPVGTTVSAAQADVIFPIDGVQHSLQMGPQPGGHCFADGTAIHGAGTTKATISRPDSTTWIVDLPQGSIGRLFDIHLSSPHAVNKGLYYVSMHFVMKR